ncbi:hypothetical protein ACFO3J_16720 [Streptomyces polygonati]|uniref:Condensation domain-containing protein n=1 Tax=Streptomyces polygonati TaxID=1617087 RepID=A0ABV8HPL9_9ACTN
MAVIELPDGAHQFVLTIHHAIADGTSAMALLAQVWESCAARTTGRRPDLPPPAQGLPDPVEDHFLARLAPADIDSYLARRATRMRALSPLGVPAREAGREGDRPETGVHLLGIELTSAQSPRLMLIPGVPGPGCFSPSPTAVRGPAAACSGRSIARRTCATDRMITYR